MTTDVNDPGLLLGCSFHDREELVPVEELPDETDDTPWDPRDAARSSPAGRRLRAVRRALADGADLRETFDQAARVSSNHLAVGDHRTIVTAVVLGAATDHGYLELLTDGPTPQLVPGRRFYPTPRVRDIEFADPFVSVVVGARALLSDPLAQWCPPPAGVSLFGLPLWVLEAVLARHILDVECLMPYLLEELDRVDPLVAARFATQGCRRTLEATLVLLADLAWVTAPPWSHDGRLPVVEVTTLGMWGYLMTLAVMHGRLPDELDALVRERGYLPFRGGYIAPGDVPEHVTSN